MNHGGLGAPPAAELAPPATLPAVAALPATPMWPAVAMWTSARLATHPQPTGMWFSTITVDGPDTDYSLRYTSPERLMERTSFDWQTGDLVYRADGDSLFIQSVHSASGASSVSLSPKGWGKGKGKDHAPVGGWHGPGGHGPGPYGGGGGGGGGVGGGGGIAAA